MPDRTFIVEGDRREHSSSRESTSLLQAEQHYRSLVENSTDVIGIIEADGRIRYISPSVTRLLGINAEKLIGQSVYHLLHEQDAARVHSAIEQLLLAPGAYSVGRHRVRHVQGFWQTIEGIAKNMVHDPAIRGIMFNARDITARQARQQQNWQKQRLESIGRLAGGIAHEFNNLLTAIRGRLQLVLDERTPTEPVFDDLEEIDQSAERAAGLTRELLAFSRKQVLRPKVLDLNAVVLEMENVVKRLVSDDITVVLTPRAHQATVLVDPTQLQQVLFNLAMHARDAMPTGGTLTISTWNVCLAQATRDLKQGDYVLLEVADTGAGINEEALPHIFEPFFTWKELGQGTGLGLSAVHGIILQSGGAIKVDSAPSRGTTFSIYLPFIDEPIEAERDSVADEDRMAGSKTILIAEDEAAVRSLTRKILERHGYRVYAASDGLEALQIARNLSEPIDLLLTDVVMPRLSGRELANRLLPERPGIKVLFMSGYSEEAIAHHGVLGPGTAFLEKPFTPDGLARKVRDVMTCASTAARRPAQNVE
jgi:two-component system, cell cycle sensor histidine kinase and response regulator CckA